MPSWGARLKVQSIASLVEWGTSREFPIIISDSVGGVNFAVLKALLATIASPQS